jgi:hypothetical protein
VTKSTNRAVKKTSEFKFLPCLLKTESLTDFASLLDALIKEVKPTNVIELMYVHDIANLIWDIMRHRRNKAGIINNAFRAALENTLRLILPSGVPSSPTPLEKFKTAAKQLANDWFYLPEDKKRVLSLLDEAGLDLQSIEAEAFRLAMPDIEKVDRLLAATEARRDKALRSIDWYRECFGEKIRQSTDRLLAPQARSETVPTELAN